MDRRELLAAAGLAGIAGTSGCLGYRVVDDERVTRLEIRNADLEARLAEQRERAEELSAQVTRQERRLRKLRRTLRAPSVNAAKLVDGWDELGDVLHRQVESTPAGEPATIAVSFSYPPRPAEFGSEDWWNGEATVAIALREAGDGNGGGDDTDDTDDDNADTEDNTDGEVRRRRETTTRLFAEPDQRLVETAVDVPTDGLDPGSYEAVVAVTDELSGLRSASLATAVELQ
jgi:hypothetical protein